MGLAADVAIEWIGDTTEKLFGRRAARVLRAMLPELPGPVMRDPRPDDGAGAPGMFRDLRYAVRASRHIMDETLWRDFAAFYRDPARLSWWAFVGREGTGKSRAALEFCRALESGRVTFFRDGAFVASDVEPVDGENYSVWRAGFLDLAATPFSAWEAWRPRQHTLLVLDNVARNYAARLGESGESEDADEAERRSRYDIAEIVKLLAEKAVKGEFGAFRVRLLLLDREYREADGEGAPLAWYENMPRYLSLQFREPAFMPAVCAEGLFSIARDMQEAVRLLDPETPYVVPRDFLDKLGAIDADLRPLFAMLLAAYVASDNDPVVTRREVFEYALWNEVSQVLQPAEVERTPQALKALVVSTLTDGRVGACKIDDAHPLWGSGLGYESDGDEVMFRLYPALPDLLGEYMVLEGVDQVDIFGSMRIADPDMRTLIRKAWEICPVDVADFFERAGQDFGVDARWIESIFLDRQIAELDAGVLGWFMHTAANLMSRFSKKEIDTARKVLEFMNEYAAPEAHHHERARASASFIRICCDAGLLEEASTVFVSLRTLKETRENRLCLADAVSCLIDGLGKAGELVRARVLFESTLAFDEAREVSAPRARALVGLIGGYGKAGDFEEARHLFDSLAACGDTEEVLAQRAKASIALILLYARVGREGEARALYEGMKALGDGPEARETRAKAGKFLDYLTTGGKAKSSEKGKETSPAVA